MKTSLIALVIASSMVVAPAFAQNAPATPPAPAAAPAAPAAEAPAEQMSAQDFASKAAMANMFEIETSKVALEKASSDDVKTFAQKMIDDHGKAAEDLKAAADSQGGITVPTDMDDEQKQNLDTLNGASGDDFDKQYIEMQTAAHEEAVSLFEDYSKNGEDGAIKDFAGKTLRTLQQHYDMVQQMSSMAGDAAAGDAAAGAAAGGAAAGAAAPMAPAPADSGAAPAAPADNSMAPAAPADNSMTPAAPADNSMTPAAPADNAAAPADNAAPSGSDQETADVDMSALSPVDLATLKGDDLKGMDVVTSDGQKIASVSDFVLNDDGKIDAVIVDFGGFLGIGTKQIAVAFEGSEVMGDQDNNRYLVVDTTKEQLDAQPAYNKDDYAANRDTQLLTTAK